MSVYFELPVYQTGYKLLIEFSKMRTSLSRDIRYTIGQELTRTLFGLLVLIARANSTYQKVPYIQQMRRLTTEVQLALRLLKDLREINLSQFAMLSDLQQQLSKQLAGWHRQSANLEKQCAKQFDAKVPSSQDGWPECVGSRFNAVSHNASSIQKPCAETAACAQTQVPSVTMEVTS